MSFRNLLSEKEEVNLQKKGPGFSCGDFMQKRETILILTLRWLVSAAGNVECTLKRKRHDSWTPTSAVAKAVQKRTSQILVVLGCGSQKQQPSRTSPCPEEQGVWKLYVDGR